MSGTRHEDLTRAAKKIIKDVGATWEAGTEQLFLDLLIKMGEWADFHPDLLNATETKRMLVLATKKSIDAEKKINHLESQLFESVLMTKALLSCLTAIPAAQHFADFPKRMVMGYIRQFVNEIEKLKKGRNFNGKTS